MTRISPKQSADGETIDAADINDPVNTITDDYNGNIDNSNIDANAAIDGSKLASGSVGQNELGDDSVDGTNIDWSATGADAGIWWEELGRTTLSSAASQITVSGMATRKYLKIYITMTGSDGNNAPDVRFNNDSGANYSTRRVNDDVQATSSDDNELNVFGGLEQSLGLCILDVINISSLEKLAYGLSVRSGGSGAGNAPNEHRYFSGKWANTSDQITRIDFLDPQNSGVNFNSGSQIIVLGHD